MSESRMTLFVKTEKVATSSADIEALGHQCASPMRTGAYDRMGAESILLNQEQSILWDATIRACKKMGWNLKIEDVSKYGFLKKLRMSEIVPRLEREGRIMTGSPSSIEIIDFFRTTSETHAVEFSKVDKGL